MYINTSFDSIRTRNLEAAFSNTKIHRSLKNPYDFYKKGVFVYISKPIFL